MLSNENKIKNDSFIFGRIIKQLNNIMDIRFNRILKQWDLTASQFYVIVYLLDNQATEVNQKNLEDVFHLKGPTVTGIVNRLVEKNFIIRHTNCHDRRVNYLVLTEKGRELEPIIFFEIDRLEKETLQGITNEQIDLLDGILNQILQNIMDD
ncbi:MarR family winged helix-turn-helix transcriptional regulator [Acetobacterium woodii]|uniref:HTH-type transcriptional regulator SarZ n=1 Tax=Acetobacterium woodii (strain ATCC 29683 / DSM 1030 / JCM 2381 / KCTC 1655 / WB1) TaxID=931626 RepID=H6LKK6_ACEWD|nr:MarR family winged helix-turn-helix transcriptional regulator [Acetobacterium woodii]AFA48798.1 transcriptional regulator MarR family [Acetobacterium woodii DSM 1030]